MYHFRTSLWLHDGDPPWHFITLPDDISDEIEERTAGRAGGFGSVRVQVTIGATTWSTSIFPDTKRGAYILPVKKEVRRREQLEADDHVALNLELVDG